MLAEGSTPPTPNPTKPTPPRPAEHPDTFWLLTWTTYGTWLPGDRRGFVSHVRGQDGHGLRHNRPKTHYDRDLPGLEHYARQKLKGAPVYLSPDHARLVCDDFRGTAAFRGWLLMAVAVMRNHVHLVVAAPHSVSPDRLFQIFKSYASRALNRHFPAPASGTWWTASGSRRRLPDEKAVRAAIAYVRNQEYPLITCLGDQEPEQKPRRKPESEPDKNT